MKKTILTLITAATAAISAMAQTTIIDFDYKKMFRVDVSYIDFDCDGDIASDELLSISGDYSGMVLFDYRDFGTAGNRLYLQFRIEEKSTGVAVLDVKGSLEDVVFKKLDIGYAVLDKLGDMVIGLEMSSGENFLSILNPAILSE